MSVRAAIERSWRKPNALTVLLWPFSQLYRLIFAVRTWSYQTGMIGRYRAPLPVIVVGNLTVGGTGKTPLIIYLVEMLRERGFTPGVISRGYGGQAEHYPCVVTANTPVEHSGDEPALIVRRTQVPMVVGPDRKASIEALMKVAKIDVILSDDGLQHLPLRRDLELCLLDATSPNENTYLLPAGPFREPLKRLKTVDFVVKHGLVQDSVAEFSAEEFAMTLSPNSPQLVSNTPDNALKAIAGPAFDSNTRFHAVAGIGNPQRFFATCRSLGYQFEAHAFKDHHVFSAEDINFDHRAVLMTEKDAVKCQKFADERHWYLPVDAKLSIEFNDALVSRLDKLV